MRRRVALQSAFRAHIGGAVSKTVHLSSEISQGLILELIRPYNTRRCNEISFFRWGCTVCVSVPATGDVEIQLRTPVWDLDRL